MIRFLPLACAFLVAFNLDAQTSGAIPKRVGSNLIDRFTKKAEYPGGYIELLKFIQKNIQYPLMERDNDIMGKVTVRFVVDTTGEVKSPEVVKRVSPGLDREAVRVVKMLPRFEPAMYYKKTVPEYYLVEVDFRIQ